MSTLSVMYVNDTFQVHYKYTIPCTRYKVGIRSEPDIDQVHIQYIPGKYQVHARNVLGRYPIPICYVLCYVPHM